MPSEVYLVKSGMTMTEGVVEEWYIADGANVNTGDMLYRMETEKINLDVDAEASGTLKHLVEIGITKEPGDVIGLIFAADETIPDTLPANAGQAAPSPVIEQPETGSANQAVQPTQANRSGPNERVFASPAARRLAQELQLDFRAAEPTGPNGRIVEDDVRRLAASPNTATAGGGKANASTPVARKLARELGVDLLQVRGSGPGGRITKEDVETAHHYGGQNNPQNRAPAAGLARADQTLKNSSMRRTIAKRMHESLQTSAQLTMDMDILADDLVKLRGQLIDEWADDNVKPSYTDLVMQACAKALVKHPLMNASFTEAALISHGAVNVGMAVALAEGLIVPVIKQADQLGLKALCQDSARLASAARENALDVADLQDGTFTVSALGMFGVDAFTPIINAPQAGILGINRLRDDVKWVDNQAHRCAKLRLSLTWDHRVLDGAPAAEFLGTVRDLLESPYRLLL